MNTPTILIDAGHGMGNKYKGVYDTGAMSRIGLSEALMTFTYARKLQGVMTTLGWSTTLTRPRLLTEITLRNRQRKATHDNPTCLISLHCNADLIPGDSETDAKTKGTEIWYRTDGSRELAVSIEHTLTNLPRRTPDIKQSNTLIILDYTPATLIEIGFIDDPDDVSNMINEDWSNEFVTALATGINNWRRYTQ